MEVPKVGFDQFDRDQGRPYFSRREVSVDCVQAETMKPDETLK